MDKSFYFHRIDAFHIKSSVFSIGCHEFSDSSARAVVTGIKNDYKRCSLCKKQLKYSFSGSDC